MTDSTTPPHGDTGAAESASKERFAKAVEEAKAGAQALGKEAHDRADHYREKISTTSSEWADQAKVRATDLAVEGKAKASEAMAGLGKIVADNAGLIDEKVGAKYGDYARTAAQSIQDAATKLDSKDINELAGDAKEFVRKSPGVAIGLAAVAGFILARAFKGSNN